MKPFLISLVVPASLLLLPGLLGLFLPATRSASHTLAIAAPPQVIWDLRANPQNQPQWRSDIDRKSISGGRHAVFLHRGPHADLPATYDRIYGHWLPHSEENLADAPAFELYLDHPDHVPPDRLRTLIHLPLLPRLA